MVDGLAGEGEDTALGRLADRFPNGRPAKLRRPGTLLVACLLGLACATLPPDDRDDPWFTAGRDAVARARARAPGMGRARNVILFVGDGMGPTTVTAARIFEGQRRGNSGEENQLAFETLPHLALAKTYNTNQQVGDSAGTMTALMSGLKTQAGVLGLSDESVLGDPASVERSRVRTLIEEAEERGLVTGIVTTTTVTHATPAACFAHTPHRAWEDDTRLTDVARRAGFPDIASQLVNFGYGDGIDVVLGGGFAHFLPVGPSGGRTDAPSVSSPAERVGFRVDGRDLTQEWQERHPGGAMIWSDEELSAVDSDSVTQVFGLFAASHLEFEVDREPSGSGQPSLSKMTAVALDLLSARETGFLLVVEGGRIDHGHHLANAYRALTDTVEFSNAVRVALERTDPEETLIVVTADHDHVLSLSGYATRGNDILGLMVKNDLTGRPLTEPDLDALGLPYTTLSYANGPGYSGASDQQEEGAKRFLHIPTHFQPPSRGRSDLSSTDTTDPSYLQETLVPLASETHGGTDVAIYAGGPGSELFDGVQEQHYVYHAIIEALGWGPSRLRAH